MFENLLQQEIPVLGIIIGAVALFFLRKAAVSMKNVSTKPVIGGAMLLMGLMAFGSSSTELSLDPAEQAVQTEKVAVASYSPYDENEKVAPIQSAEEPIEAVLASLKTEKNAPVADKRYVPKQIAGGTLALSIGLIICGIATSIRGWRSPTKK